MEKRNWSDDYENELLDEFRQNPQLKELTGIRTDLQELVYYIARPVFATRKMFMKCHGNVADAPKEMVALYGSNSGFNYKKGSVVGPNIIYVPTSVPIATAKKSTLIVAIVFTVLFFILFLFINLLIRKSIISPIESFVKTADQVSRGKFDNVFDVDTEGELKTLADAFTRLKASIILMMKRMKKPS